MFNESSDDITWPDLQGQGLRIGLVQARFNTAVTQGLLKACQDELTQLGVAPQDQTVITVPGALEVPLALQSLASLKAFDALVSDCKADRKSTRLNSSHCALSRMPSSA